MVAAEAAVGAREENGGRRRVAAALGEGLFHLGDGAAQLRGPLEYF